MEELFAGYPCAIVVDDLLVWGEGTVEHDVNLRKVLQRRREVNRPFPSCCLPRFRSESWCLTIVREMSLICIRIRNSFPFEWLCTRTRYETEACSNSEMGYLQPRSLKLTPKKCKFRLDQVAYVGYVYTKEGLKPDEAKVKAIKEIPPPDSPEALHRFLGMINYKNSLTWTI